MRKLTDIHAEALRRFQLAYDANLWDREQSLEARRFVDIRGAQWDWDINNDFATRMKLEVNMVALACTRIVNEYRNNQIEARFIPKDGTEADPLAEACAGKYRADFTDSNGKEARDNAFDEGLKGGFGAWRLRTEYEDEAEGKQRICFEPIHDAATSVFFDPNSLRKDKSDAEYCFIIRPYSREAYEEIWGEDVSSFPAEVQSRYSGYAFPWIGINKVYVAEYFCIERKPIEKRRFKWIDDEVTEYEEIEDDEVSKLLAQGYEEIEPVRGKKTRVKKYTLSGSKILDKSYIAGDRIPVVPFFAHRQVIDGTERFRGHVAFAMDPQIIQNIQFSKVAETAALSAIEKPIFAPEQIAGHENMWQSDNVNNFPFLLANPLKDVSGNIVATGPIGVTKAPAIPEAVAGLITLSNQSLVEILGNPAAGEQIQSNTSGIAVELAQARMDMQTSGYLDNLGDAERLAGEIWLGMAREVYVEPKRKVKVLSDGGDRNMVELGRKVMDEDGAIVSEIDFARAQFDVSVDVGPSSASKRAATVRAVTEIMGAVVDPQMQAILGHVAVMNLEGLGLQDVRAWARKQLVGMGVVPPSKEEQSQMEEAQQQQPSAQDQLAMALAQKNLADAELRKVQVAGEQADTEKTIVETAQMRSGVINA